MPDLVDLNWIAIILSTFVAGGLGAAWYSPLLFGKAWMDELGMTEEDLGPSGVALGGSVFSCLIASIAMAILLADIGVHTLVGGLKIGALVGGGIVAMTMLSDALFSGWSMKLYIIQVGYRAVYLTLIGGILGVWPK